ncbi:ATP-binding protein [Streptomyces sp. J2-1]|uniref:ATP-binding protein n=1 Tax=Streptomyces corallincola TaxID=2851888 RepID=UPI001C37F365|nr:ATP-binding protein [Streptomyces corallincola]MBV2356256.1 ATP-binding protein [Streptomyces corallincola]
MDMLYRTTTTTRTRPAPLGYSRTWDAGVTCIGEARDAVAALLAHARPEPSAREVQDAQLVVSELVTNAVKHAPGPCGLSLELTVGPRTLRIAVTDSSPEPPRERPPNARRIGGHGLRLVRMLSAGVEVTPLPGGKRVTATVPLGGPSVG